jgi:multidrug efflux pump subunit AcrB
MIAWCVRHKQMTALFSVLLILSGAAAYLSLGRQENPAVTAPAALVYCVYPGATPEDVEKSVLIPLEKELGTLTGVKNIESVAMANTGVVKIYLEDMSDADTEQKFNDIRESVNRAEPELPAEAEKPVVNTQLSSTYGVVLGLSSAQHSSRDLEDVAHRLQKELAQVPGIAAVDLAGEIGEEISVRLDMVKLEQYGLAPLTIATALQAHNISIPGGSLELDGRNAPVRLAGEYASAEEIRNTVVSLSPATGLPVYLRNVADVEQTERKKSVFAFVGNQPAVLIGVKYEEEGNVVSIGSRVRQEIDALRDRELYAGMELTVLTDQADFTREAIRLFISNFLSAVALVVLVVWLSMGLRSALIVSAPIALVVAAVCVVMFFLRIPLHQVSVASLIISLSLLVANGVVANENMYLSLETEPDRFVACTTGARQVAVPILTSTLTTIASFLPLAMMQGVAGKFAYSLPILVSVALLVSFFTAMTVVPAAGHRFLQPKKNSPLTGLWQRFGGSQGDASAKGLFPRWLDRALRHPRLTVLLFVAALVLSAMAVPGLGVQVFPPLEREQYTLEITAPGDYTAEQTGRLALEAGELLAAEPSVLSYACTVGSGFMKYYMTFSGAASGANKAEFLVNGSRAESQAVARRISLAAPDAVVRAKSLEFNMPQDYPVQIRIAGEDLTTLRSAAEEVQALVASVRGVQRTEINYGYAAYELRLEVDDGKAALAGVTNYDIAATVRMAVNGTEVSTLKQNDLSRDPLPVILRVDGLRMQSREDLDRIFIRSQATGANVPLRSLTRVSTASTLHELVRRDQERTITVGLLLENNYGVQGVIRSCEKALADYAPPAGYTLRYGGENEFTQETLGSMVYPAILAALLIYVVLALQFGKLLDPLIIMGTIPLSFIGIICGLRLMGYPIGFMALLGAISLMGVVVNNGIVLLDYIKVQQAAGLDLRQAVLKAGVVRRRPIVIGMVTTVISLLPMMLAGGALWAPLATSVIAGMLVSTLSTLFVIPCMYYVIYRGRPLLEKIRKE